MRLIGIINDEGYIQTENGETFSLPIRSRVGYGEILMNTSPIDGEIKLEIKTVKSLMGKKVEFTISDSGFYGLDVKLV